MLLRPKILIQITVFLFNFFIVTLAIPNAGTQPNSDAIRHAKSEEMQKYMDQFMDPCHDFYKFACGHWHLTHPATMENKQTLYMYKVSSDYVNKLAAILFSDDPDDTNTLKKVKNFYRSCLNVSPVRSVYKDKLLEIVREFGEMPALEDSRWQATDFDWLKTIGRIAYKYNLHIIFDYEMINDPLDKMTKKLEFRPTKFALPEFSMYLNENEENAEYRRKYREKIAENLKEFLELDKSLAAETAAGILEFEILLVKGIRSISGADTLSIDGLQAKYKNQLDFKKFFRTALGSLPETGIIEKFPNYQKNLVDIINAIDQRKVANFIFYYLLSDFMEAAHRPEKSPQHTCTYTTRRFFHPFLEHMMYHKLNLSPTTRGVQNMFTDLKSMFQSDLQSAQYNWMGNETRRLAVQKLQAMTIEIRSYEHIDFDEKYQHLQMSSHAFIENLKSLFIQFGNQTRDMTNDLPNRMFDDTNILYGPGYEVQENRVIIPIVSLLPHYFYSQSYPHALNLGQLGTVVAHEIVHGFDNNGQLIDSNGHANSWWDVNSTNNFTQKSQCFRNQYKGYIFGGRPLPERYDQTENIADNGGVRLAFDAYMNWFNSPWLPKALIQTEHMPGLRFTGPQLFFLSYAQVWCGETHPNFINEQTTRDHHTPGQFRVVGVLSNMKEFSKVFDCRPGSPMNPANKCEIY